MNALPLRLEKEAALRDWIAAGRRDSRTLGIVPTMGALHDGHLSLVCASQAACDRTIVTIFVNPTQFGPQEDLSRYPRTLPQDLQLLARLRVDAVFVPRAETIYPDGFSTYVEPPAVAGRWEGELRPGHFRGVATVVLKLFQLIPADLAFFGEKDYQQCRVIEDMVRDLNVPVAIRRCPIIRESDGLALSSRNRYLDASQRQRAVFLSRALRHAQGLVREGERRAEVLRQEIERLLREGGVDRVDYVAIVDAVRLEPVVGVAGDPVRVLVAAHVGTTRLIDNIALP